MHDSKAVSFAILTDDAFARITVDGMDDVGEVLRTAICEIIAIDRSDDDMVEAELGDGVGDVATLRDAARLAQALGVREARGLLERAGRAVEALRGAWVQDPAAVWPFELLNAGGTPGQ